MITTRSFSSRLVIPLLTAGFLQLVSCVPGRQFEEVKQKNKKCEDELATQKTRIGELDATIEGLKDENARQKKAIENLSLDTAQQGKMMRRLEDNFEKLSKTHELLLGKNKELLATNQNETTRLMSDLQGSQEKLQKKEDELRKLEKELETRKTNLDQLKADLDKKQARVNELEGILHRKDSVVAALKAKVQDALLGFVNKGLTIEQKNGKVYVSLEERLLFASGSTVVDPKGAEALRKLSKVLETNKDINVMVEGHTDNVPYNSAGGAIKDNWDLSVLRATSITKILLEGSTVDPRRITASGRGEFVPVDPANNAEARKKNRRTEIILTPKLDELLKILENN